MLAPSATPPSESIDELIERCLAGDERAWDRIVALHWRRVFNVAFKFVGRHDQAEDLAHFRGSAHSTFLPCTRDTRAH